MMAVRSPYTRSDWYVGVRFDPVKDNVASERDEKKHNELRAMMAPGVSLSLDLEIKSDVSNVMTSTLAKKTRILKEL